VVARRDVGRGGPRWPAARRGARVGTPAPPTRSHSPGCPQPAGPCPSTRGHSRAVYSQVQEEQETLGSARDRRDEILRQAARRELPASRSSRDGDGRALPRLGELRPGGLAGDPVARGRGGARPHCPRVHRPRGVVPRTLPDGDERRVGGAGPAARRSGVRGDGRGGTRRNGVA
jgi:hypothetical protein